MAWTALSLYWVWIFEFEWNFMLFFYKLLTERNFFINWCMNFENSKPMLVVSCFHRLTENSMDLKSARKVCSDERKYSNLLNVASLRKFQTVEFSYFTKEQDSDVKFWVDGVYKGSGYLISPFFSIKWLNQYKYSKFVKKCLQVIGLMGQPVTESILNTFPSFTGIMLRRAMVSFGMFPKENCQLQIMIRVTKQFVMKKRQTVSAAIKILFFIKTYSFRFLLVGRCSGFPYEECSNRGDCIDGECYCDYPYFGDSCQCQ